MSANGFIVAFLHIRMKGIRHVFDKNNVQYQKYNIKQALKMKDDLEKIGIKNQNIAFVHRC